MGLHAANRARTWNESPSAYAVSMNSRSAMLDISTLPRHNAHMAAPATFDSFATELARLVAKFEKEIHEVKAVNYSEARLRED